MGWESIALAFGRIEHRSDNDVAAFLLEAGGDMAADQYGYF